MCTSAHRQNIGNSHTDNHVYTQGFDQEISSQRKGPIQGYPHLVATLSNSGPSFYHTSCNTAATLPPPTCKPCCHSCSPASKLVFCRPICRRHWFQAPPVGAYLPLACCLSPSPHRCCLDPLAPCEQAKKGAFIPELYWPQFEDVFIRNHYCILEVCCLGSDSWQQHVPRRIAGLGFKVQLPGRWQAFPEAPVQCLS